MEANYIFTTHAHSSSKILKQSKNLEIVQGMHLNIGFKL